MFHLHSADMYLKNPMTACSDSLSYKCGFHIYSLTYYKICRIYGKKPNENGSTVFKMNLYKTFINLRTVDNETKNIKTYFFI